MKSTWSGPVLKCLRNIVHTSGPRLGTAFLYLLAWITPNLLQACMGRTCKYGGEPEYWVETRETGEKGSEKEEKKKRIEISEDSLCPYTYILIILF